MPSRPRPRWPPPIPRRGCDRRRERPAARRRPAPRSTVVYRIGGRPRAMSSTYFLRSSDVLRDSGMRRGHVAAVHHRPSRARRFGAQPGDAERRRAHVHAAPPAAEVSGTPIRWTGFTIFYAANYQLPNSNFQPASRKRILRTCISTGAVGNWNCEPEPQPHSATREVSARARLRAHR